ncbi:MAG TPA: histidinol-phosphate transaminase [Eubacteriaceae bacterium]|nr:histidinol-phosphate transaminase [Eubacteriaceae bacterium]
MPSGGDFMIETMIKPHLKDFQNYAIADNDYDTVINANESPYNCFDNPELKEKLYQALETYKSNVYPDGASTALRQSASNFFEVEPDELICGNGSDEVIAMIYSCFISKGDSVVATYPSFDMYTIGAKIAGANFYPVPDTDARTVDINKVINVALETDAKLIFLCTPNNPTGYMIPEKEIKKVIDKTNAIVVIDEAYIEFSDRTSIPFIREYEQVIVLRTMSKAFGFAGLRVGFAAASKKMIEYLNKVKQPYNLNSLSQLLAKTTLDNRHLVLPLVDEIKNRRDLLLEELKAIEGLTVYDSEANFILIKTEQAKALYDAFIEEGILVKYYGQKPGLQNCIRLTVTTEEINNRLIEIIERVIHHA